MNENKFINIALKQAQKAFKLGEVPVGAVITKNNEIISQAHNLIKSKSNPLAHAEVIAISRACKKIKSQKLNDCNIYITLEPCLMCTGLILNSNIKNIFYCLNEPKFGALESNPINISQFSYNKPNIYSNISAAKSEKLLKEFFNNKR